ncbi:MAG: hypothetical protein AAF234_11510 [Pseudomonadota bacterium]
MDAGLGHPKNIPWTQKAFANAAGISPNTPASWLRPDGARELKSKSFEKVFSTFFPLERDALTEPARELRRVFNEANKTAKSIKLALDEKRFSELDVWNAVMRTKNGEFLSVVRGMSNAKGVRFEGFAPGELALTETDEQFFLEIPTTLRSKVESGEINYDIHADGAREFSDTCLESVHDQLPGFDLLGAISKYSELYASRVVEAFESDRVTQKPYNKPKYGVRSVTSHIPANKDETTAGEVHLYRTDFFSHWVISQTFKDMQKQHPEWLTDMSKFPTLSVNGKEVYFPHLTMGIGLNCFIICQPEYGARTTCFTRLGNASSQPRQHNRLHVPVNEGLNTEDYDEERHEVSLNFWWKRMIREELGGDLDLDRFEFEALSVFLDTTVGELGVLGVIVTDYTVAELDVARTKTARDLGREFVGSLIEIPATEVDLIEFVISQPNSVQDFVTYTPHLIDMIVRRRIFQSGKF